MSARISRAFSFKTGTYYSGEFFVNNYDIDVQFLVETESIREQNIAMDRIKYFISECLEHSVMVFEGETQAIDKFIDAGMKVCTLPEEPYDQIIGIMLLVKMNAIAEGRLTALDISIVSSLSDEVYFHHDLEENIGPFRLQSWWNEPSTKITNYVPKSKGKKVVKLVKHSHEWAEHGLTWEETPLEPKTASSEVVFAQFDSKKDT